MSKANKIKIRKEEGRNVHFYDVYTAEHIDRILSSGRFGSGDGSGSGGVDPDPGGGFGQKIGVTTEDLNGLVQTFGVRLNTAISAGRDYLVRNQEGNIYSFTPASNVQVGLGTVDLGTDDTIIIALSGSGIYEQTPQQEAENREFRERMIGLRESLDTLDLDLTELNEEILPALDERVVTLKSYFEDPNNIPEDFTFFTGIVSNEIWALEGTFMELWFDRAFGNSLMANRIVTNHIGVGQVVAEKIDTADLAATLAFIQKLFAQEIALVLDMSVTPNKGGLIRSTNFDGTINDSNQIIDYGEFGWAIDYSGNSVLHNAFIRGTAQSSNYDPGLTGWQIHNDGTAEFLDGYFRGKIVVSGDGSNVPTDEDLTGEINGLNDFLDTDYGTHRNFYAAREAAITLRKQIDSAYSKLYGNTDLTGVKKTALKDAYDAYVIAHDSFVTYLAHDHSGYEFLEAQTRLDLLYTKITEFQNAYEEAIDSIGSTKVANLKLFTQSELDDAAVGMGYIDFEDLRAKAAEGTTIIDGGFIRTDLIVVNELLAKAATITDILTMGTGGKITNAGADYIIDSGGLEIKSGDTAARRIRFRNPLGAEVYGYMSATSANYFLRAQFGADLFLQSEDDTRVTANNDVSLEAGANVVIEPNASGFLHLKNVPSTAPSGSKFVIVDGSGFLKLA